MNQNINVAAHELINSLIEQDNGLNTGQPITLLARNEFNEKVRNKLSRLQVVMNEEGVSDDDPTLVCPKSHQCTGCQGCVVSGGDCWAFDGHHSGCQYEDQPGVTGQEKSEPLGCGAHLPVSMSVLGVRCYVGVDDAGAVIYHNLFTTQDGELLPGWDVVLAEKCRVCDVERAAPVHDMHIAGFTHDFEPKDSEDAG